jgi:hypothetical protein
MRRFVLPALCVWLVTVGPCQGGSEAKHAAPLETTPDAILNGDLVLNGAGIRNYLFFDIYRIALYLPQRDSDVRQVLRNEVPRRVQITLLRDISAERDIGFLMAGLEDNNSAEELAAIQGAIDQFMNLIRRMGKVPKGQIVQLDYHPSYGTRVWLNSRLLGVVPGAVFNRSLLKIWLGDNPIEKALKRALLGDSSASL